ncbi:MAG: HEAT repeat domain-containing protein [Trichodesmium sp. St16_bin4-tuft]|nr:HEAT repeat domain-containing protein [Trichodesmium sp. St16_bin4-tuft]
MVTTDIYQQLKNKNPVLRQRAMSKIVEEPTSESIPQLIEILSDENPNYRNGATQTLTVIGLPAIPALAEELINNDSHQVRASCVQAFSEIARFFPHDYPGETFPQIAIDALHKALNDPSSAIQVAATGALGTIGKPALEILLSALDTEDIALRLSVIQAIVSSNVLKGAEDDPKTIEDYDRIANLLSKIAEDETVDSYIRETAQAALTRMAASKVKTRY